MIELNQIREARSIIDEYKNIEILEDIFEYKQSFFIKISILVNNSQNIFVPSLTKWYIKFTEAGADFYPSKDQGINVTFQHQSLNVERTNVAPFLNGKLCLDRPVHAFNNEAFRYLPNKYIDKFKWFLDRAIDWIEKASQNLLVSDGDPFELPVIKCQSKMQFIYKESSLDKWKAFQYEYGFAKIDKQTIGKEKYYILKEIYDANQEEARGTVFFGDYFDNSENISKLSMWIKLKRIPIQKPWMFPCTWEELNEIAKQQNIDIRKIISTLLVKSNMVSAGRFLAICFPIPKTIGGPMETISWLFISLPEFNFPDKGFRKTLAVKKNFYMNKLKGQIDYYDCDNFDSKYLLSRGRIAKSISTATTSIIGIGSLGSILAETFSRIGIEDLRLFDSDIFYPSNVARHILNLDNNFAIKSTAVKEKIIKNNPNIKVKEFENLDGNNVNKLKSSDLIVDCSANNEVIEILSKTKFNDTKFFVVAAFGYAAKDFIVYCNKGTNFNNVEYQNLVIPIYKKIVDDLNITEKNFIMQGIGCYHPVFPARCDDVIIWSGMLIKTIEKFYDKEFESCFVHFRQNGLSVEVFNEWIK